MTSQTYNLDGPKEFPFPYPVRSADQLTVEIVPGAAVAPGDYEVVGVGPTSTQVTVRYPNAPTSGGLQLKITRYVAPERVTQIDSPSDINVTNLNAEFNNVYEAMVDLEATVLQQVQDELDDFQTDVLDPAVATTVQARDVALAARDAAQAAETGATEKWDDFRDRYWGAYATDPTESPVGNPPDVGDLYFNTTASEWRVWNGTAWQQPDTKVPSVYDRRDYVATEGQDTFAVNYDAPFVQVWVNGALLPPSDYEASSGTDVVLDEGVPEDTEVTVVGIGGASATELDTLAALVFETYEATLAGYTTDAEAAALSSEQDADRAENARDAAQLTAGVYDDTTAGLAATTGGDYFSVPSATSDEFLILYRNDAGVATEIDSYPNADAVRKRVIFVPDIADLLALTGVQDGQRVSVTGYHPGSDIGGGPFYYDASRSKSEHNGGTVISPTVPWDGSQGTLADFLNGVGETDSGSTGCWVRPASDKVRPHSFGAIDGQDSTDAAQEFLAAMGSDTPHGFDLTCSIIVSSQMILDGTGSPARDVSGRMTFTVVSDLKNPENMQFMTIRGCHYWVFRGGFHVDAYNGFDSIKLVWNAFNIEGCARAEFGYLGARGAEGFAVRNIDGNSNILTIRHISAKNCGYDGTSRNRGYNTRSAVVDSYSGASTSTTHRMNVTVDMDDVPADIRSAMLVAINDTVHTVEAYDSETKTASLWPGLFPDFAVGDNIELRLITGGGYQSDGGDSGEMLIDKIDCQNSGIAVRDRSLYGAIIHRMVAQHCGAGFVSGYGVTSIGGQGTVLIQPYFEGCFREMVSVSSAGKGTVLAPIEMTPALCVCLSAPFFPQTASTDRFSIYGDLASGAGRERAIYGAEYSLYQREVTLSDPLHLSIDFDGESRTDHNTFLSEPSGLWRTNSPHFLAAARTWTVYGRSSQYTIAAAGGYTVNGQASIVYPEGVPDGTLFKAQLRGTDWLVREIRSIQAGQAPDAFSVSTTYDPAELLDGESATTTVTVTGAALGDFATASFGADLQGVTLDAWVSAADTVSVKFSNNTGAAVDLGSATLRARVEKA